jgi:RND family efflux transporter MFP subunit
MEQEMKKARDRVIPLVVLLIGLVGTARVHADDERSSAEPQASVHTVPVTVTVAESRELEVWESSVGQLEAKTAPTIAAEVGGRIIAVAVDVGQEVKAGQVLAEIDPEDFRLAKALAVADIERLRALIHAQKLQVKRLQTLVERKTGNQSSLDEAVAQLGALQAQLTAARVRLQQAERDIARARITVPVNGKVDERHISMGDYVKAGTPLFHITTLDQLRARLPFPESLGSKLRVGLPAKLRTPVAPKSEVVREITDIRPEITPTNRAIDVIIDLDNPGDWEPGASVTGAVRVALHEGAVVVPEASVVRRPAGTVVYVIEEGRAVQRVVETGLQRDGVVEILSGLKAGERVAVDGAGFLTDGAAVEVKGS